MNNPDIDEVLNYLSTKFNKIFCDREFVCCVSEDFKIVLNNKNKCCVLVFPVLGPIYLKALRYQAKIFDLAVIHLTCNKFKSVAVCNKNFIKKVSESKEVVTMPFGENGGVSRRKRPERQLYVPPAQRRSSREKSTNDPVQNNNTNKKSDRKYVPLKAGDKIPSMLCSKSRPEHCSLISLKDFVQYIQDYYFLPLNWSYDVMFMPLRSLRNIKYFITDIFVINSLADVPIYNISDKLSFLQLLNSYRLTKQPSFEIMDLSNKYERPEGRTYPIFNFKNILDTPKRKPSYNLIVDYEIYGKEYFKEIMSQFDKYKSEFNIFKIQYEDKKCSVSVDDVIINMSMLNYGHFFFIKHSDTIGYFCECSEDHDIFKCYHHVKNQLSKNRDIVDHFTNLMTERVNKESILLNNQNFPPNDLKAFELENNIKNATTNNNNNNDVNFLQHSGVEDTAPPKNELEEDDKKIVRKKSAKKNEHEEEKEIMRKTKENINRKTRPIMKYVDYANATLDIDKDEDDLNNWEDLFDDDGELQEELFSEISNKVGSDATIVKAAEDYSAYTAKPIEELEHIVELYDFPPTLATHDIVQTFSFINSEAMYIKWVDDTHALLVLGTLSQARKAIEVDSPLIKVRPMSAASGAALAVAYKSELKPAMKRPQTNLQTARRLITSHLGARSKVNREQSAKEREDLKAARELKKLAKQNERDAWEGNLRSSIN